MSFTLLSNQNRMSALEVSDCDGQADCFRCASRLLCVTFRLKLAVVHWSCAYVAFVSVDWPLPGAPSGNPDMVCTVDLCLRIEIGYIKHNNRSRALHTQIARIRHAALRTTILFIIKLLISVLIS